MITKFHLFEDADGVKKGEYYSIHPWIVEVEKFHFGTEKTTALVKYIAVIQDDQLIFPSQQEKIYRSIDELKPISDELKSKVDAHKFGI
jgi:hypothetical protein